MAISFLGIKNDEFGTLSPAFAPTQPITGKYIDGVLRNMPTTCKFK